MKYFREVVSRSGALLDCLHVSGKVRTVLVVTGVVVGVTGAIATVDCTGVPGATKEDNALYRLMQMPVHSVMGPRPPKESLPLLSQLISSQPTEELYAIRAMQAEAALDFASAETDWKKHAEVAKNRTKAQLEVADFYHRRLRPEDEIAALGVIARGPAPANEKFTDVPEQSPWRAFERIEKVAGENALAPGVYEANFHQWVARYPEQKQVYSRCLQFLLDHKEFDAAEKLVGDYRARFPDDHVFTVKARALLAYRRGSKEQGLAVYEKEFQPLWPQELVQSYFDLLDQTRSTRKFVDEARAALERDPNNLNAVARLYHYYQRTGRADAARQTLISFRARKEQRNGKWAAEELSTLAQLNEATKNYPESARNYYALYSGAADDHSRAEALAGLVRILLEAPEQGVALGSGNLAMYRDVATMDTGPGYLNGLLSLVLNSTGPSYMYAREEQTAVPYFHHAEAAELLRLLDVRHPNAPQRATLHARMLQTLTTYAENEAIIRDGQQFLTAFPNAPERTEAALLLADAYARTKREQEEFKVYDVLLADLAKKSDGMPLGLQERTATYKYEPPKEQVTADTADEGGDAEADDQAPARQDQRAFAVNDVAKQTETRGGGPRSPEYSRVLERYLSRLVSTDQLPAALAVLRKEVDRNPDDPGLYERLAQFLDQNRLGEQQEQVYKKAIEKFDGANWYHKLARFYLRHDRNADFARLTERVTQTFSGTELEPYFGSVVRPGDFYVRMNEFAHKRFPHDLVFVRNLLAAQGVSATEKDALLREHWWEAEDLRNRFFEMLSRTGKLDVELAALRRGEASEERGSWAAIAQGNPVAARFVGEAYFWRSRYEEGAPAMSALAAQFPADAELGSRASAVYRSLAAFEPRNTETAVAIEESLYKADPGNRETLARIGDILADRELFERAAPYWDLMTTVRPGEAQAYLDPATIYWDYYNFEGALAKLEEGRKKLGNPALYSYQAGAIYETKRDYAAAIREYLKGALAGEGSRSRTRLLELARRPKLREAIDDAVASLQTTDKLDLNIAQLRMAVLEAESRTKDIEALLTSVATHSKSPEMLEWVEQTARARSLAAVEQTAMEKQAEVTTDPVRRIELRYAVVRLLDQREQTQAAARAVDSIYHDNPKLLGVVRFTTDFYWRNKQPQRAVEVLLEAGNVANQDYRKQFRYEAARKATEAGQYEQARKLLAQLLSESPRDEQYVAAMADTFARAGDDAGLKNFYLQTLADYRNAQVPLAERNRQVAGLRRGLIPALTRLKDYAGAVDQYIEIINKYPDDEPLTGEAALYAQRYGRREQLLDYYANAMKQSPRDSHWPVVLARVQAQLEDYPAAIETYAAALRIRPDRVDLHTARADLLERVLRLDDAVAEYQKLYDLNYHDPQWMEKVALIRARQGRSVDVVAALRVALIEGRPEKALNYFEVARRLDGWNILAEAREFAQKGVDVAGRDLLARSENQGGAELYARIMTRLRQQGAAYERLRAAVSDADSFASAVGVTVTQVEKNGLAVVSDRQWREQVLQGRRSAAQSGMQAALRSMGTTVGEYFTPEEKSAFAAELQKNAAAEKTDLVAEWFIPCARSADFAELEAQWLERVMLAKGKNGYQYERTLIQHQSKRLQYRELGSALEKYATAVPSLRQQVLMDAARTYRAGGLYDAELDALGRVSLESRGRNEQRYEQLLLQRNPQKLVQLSAGTRGDAYTQVAIERGSEQRALDAVRSRGVKEEPVWTNAYTALTGLYFGDRGVATGKSFTSALGGATIGERVGKPVDRKQQLAGKQWFYYGSRYGEWLGLSNADEADDYVAAVLEQSPGMAGGYVSVAEYYERAGEADRALEDYARALELASNRADVHDRMALLYWKQNNKAEATAHWKLAFESLHRQVNGRGLSDDFWTNLSEVLQHVGERGLLSELRPQADSVLRDYIRYNGTYSVDTLLRAAYKAAGNPQDGVAWLLDVAQAAPEPVSMYTMIAQANWIPPSAREPIYLRLIDQLKSTVHSSQSLAQEYAVGDLRQWQVRYARYLASMKQYERAMAVLDSLPKQAAIAPNELEIRYRVALASGKFDSILEHYRTVPDDAPAIATVRIAALALQAADEKAAARKLMEYVYEQEIASHQLTASNLLGLAQIKLENNDLPGAMEQLRRVTLVVGEPYENLDAAADVLAKNRRHAEAAEFLAQLAKATPWDSSARVKLAREEIAAARDESAARTVAAEVARSERAKYAERLQAAELAGARQTLGSAELEQIASGAAVADAADKPFFYTAPIRAAQHASGADRSRLLSNTVKEYPNRDDGRVPLFAVLQAAGKQQLALSAIEPLMNTDYFSRGRGALPVVELETPTPRDVRDAVQADSSDYVPDYVGREYVRQYDETASVRAQDELNDRALRERAGLATQVAKAYVAIDDPRKAITYERTALAYLVKAAAPTTEKAVVAQRALANRNIRRLLAGIERDAQNRTRMPVIHSGLEQANIVRPKLGARAPATPKSMGGAQ